MKKINKFPRLSTLSFYTFFESEKTSGIFLILCTIASLAIANSILGHDYLSFWQLKLGPLSTEHWINDGLMAIFFLLIGLELKRELISGELSNFRHALLPITAAIGGMVVPAAIHFGLNAGTATQSGIGIPMATDIAFALGILALLGSRIPLSLKVFVVAFAVIDDLGAVIIIALFYTTKLSIAYLAGAAILCSVLYALNKMKVMSLIPYLIGGAIMWVLMLKSGVHATIAGIALAFTIPYSHKNEDQKSPSYQLEHTLHKPVAFFILPIFALANTGVTISPTWIQDIMQSQNSLGIIYGLVLGKVIGVTLFSLVAIRIGICQLPDRLSWHHLLGAGLLGGIGFTMSIFITNLAFIGNAEIINASKMAILLASFVAGALGFIWLRFMTPVKK
ncbi:MAG: Na+/H+ antiporter NhaA [Methylophilaceae bacterium]